MLTVLSVAEMETRLEHTGERFIPGVTLSAWTRAFHISRYQFTLGFANGKDVLDIGCGAGYGTAMLAKVARSAVGCDVSLDAVGFASQRYKAANLRFIQMDCRALSLPASAFDVVISFELIEHISEQERLLAEARRVLREHGVFLVSTPEKTKYNQLIMKRRNKYHVKELSESEFRELLGSHFRHVQVFWQIVDPLVLEVMQQVKQIGALQKQVAELEAMIKSPYLPLVKSLAIRITGRLIPKGVKNQPLDSTLQERASQGSQLPQPEHISVKPEPTLEATYMVAVCQR